jgi:hypothetical protein
MRHGAQQSVKNRQASKTPTATEPGAPKSAETSLGAADTVSAPRFFEGISTRQARVPAPRHLGAGGRWLAGTAISFVRLSNTDTDGAGLPSEFHIPFPRLPSGAQ